ncbi:serine/threonine kinase [Naegleria gruberi]|uniref:Serine/threonine kinase n=1 Tax=Naegleria gruberi TaxID=5762 RepID=D2V6B0_NAEGR|nr:serine/threonine kinase [Naegleria gruberi]EFC47416.1 serine/threonine kinase [Naegleria gruberi]|eukprot:XP_002680160.1 serine/threonine kinase [Naegleria gruberi strain NEG-M]
MINKWFGSSSSPPPQVSFGKINSPTKLPTNSKVSDEIEQNIRKAANAILKQDWEVLQNINLELIINDNSVQGETLLMTAVRKKCSREIIEFLAQVSNIDFMVKNLEGESLLEVAIRNKRYNTINLLRKKYKVSNEIRPKYLIQYLYAKLIYSDSNNFEDFSLDSSGEINCNFLSNSKEVACQFFEYANSYRSLLESIVNKSTANAMSVRYILSHKSVTFECWEEYIVKMFAEMMAYSYPHIIQKPISSPELVNPEIDRSARCVISGNRKNKLTKVKLNGIEVLEKFSTENDLQNELDVFKKIKCDGVVKLLHDFTDEYGITHLILELMDCSLADCSTQLTNFGVDNFGMLIQVLFICVKCCETMKYLHRDNIIHYDIKPANILINMTEVDGIKLVKDVKIADFDVSLIVENVETYSATIGGTYQYMAPELYERLPFQKAQNNSMEYVLTAFDVYSFGVTMFELLARRHVETDERLESFLSAKELLETFPCLTHDQARKLVKIGNSCLEADPKKRPPFEKLHKYFLEVTASILKKPKSERNQLYSLSLQQSDRYKIPQPVSNNHFTEQITKPSIIESPEKKDKKQLTNPRRNHSSNKRIEKVRDIEHTKGSPNGDEIRAENSVGNRGNPTQR